MVIPWTVDDALAAIATLIEERARDMARIPRTIYVGSAVLEAIEAKCTHVTDNYRGSLVEYNGTPMRIPMAGCVWNAPAGAIQIVYRAALGPNQWRADDDTP